MVWQAQCDIVFENKPVKPDMKILSIFRSVNSSLYQSHTGIFLVFSPWTAGTFARNKAHKNMGVPETVFTGDFSLLK